ITAMIYEYTVAPDAVETKIMLQVDGVDRSLIYRARGAAVALFVALLDAPADIRPVCARGVRLVDRRSHATDRWVGCFYSRHQIGGKGCDSAAPGNSGSDEGDPHYTILR